MDIKLLREVGVGGLERWEPVFKASFPLDREQIEVVFEALQEVLPPLERGTYTVEQLTGRDRRAPRRRPSGPGGEAPGALHHRGLHRRGTRRSRTGSWLTRTIAIESTDKDAVAAAVRVVGLGPRVNTTTPAVSAALFDNEPPRYATIDVGHELGEVPRRPAGRRRPLGDAGGPCGGDAAGGGAGPERRDLRRGRRSDGRSDRGMVAEAREHLAREIAAGGHRGAADRLEPRRRAGGRRGRPGGCASRSSRARRRAGWPISRQCPASGSRRGHRGLRHRRRQFAVHLRARRRGARAVQRQCRGGPLHRAVRPDGRRGRSDRGGGEGLRSPKGWRASTAGPHRTGWWGWAAP